MSEAIGDGGTAGPAVDLAGLVELLSSVGVGAADDVERIDQIRQLEELKGALPRRHRRD